MSRSADTVRELQAEVERLREDANTQHAAWEQATEMLGEATMEVERLRDELDEIRNGYPSGVRRESCIRELEAEVERLTAQARDALTSQLALQDEVERLRATAFRCDACPVAESFDGLRREVEAERILRRQSLEEVAVLRAEVEVYRAEGCRCAERGACGYCRTSYLRHLSLQARGGLPIPER